MKNTGVGSNIVSSRKKILRCRLSDLMLIILGRRVGSRFGSHKKVSKITDAFPFFVYSFQYSK